MSSIKNEIVECDKSNNIDMHSENEIENYTYNLNVVKEDGYKGKYIDINLDRGCKEKFIEIEMQLMKYLRIFGVVKDSKGNIAKDIKMILFRAELINYKTEYVPVCEIITNDRGEYQVIIDNVYGDNHYSVKIC